MNSMYLALGYRCNHHCYFCPCGNREEKTPAASTDELIAAIRQGIDARQVTHITLSGGEPTLHPGFHDILAYCLENRLAVGILSNGDTFHSVESVHRYFDEVPPGNLQITTALHSHQAALHNRVTGKADSFQNTVEGLLNVMSLHIPVTLKQVISAWNYRDLPDFVDFAYRTFGPGVSLTLCGMDFCGMPEKWAREVAVPFLEMGPYLEEALELVGELRKAANAFPLVTVADLPLCCVDPCYWRYFTKVSRNTLSQYSAPRDDGGSVSAEISIINDCDTFFRACSECGVQALCPGVWRTASRLFGESAVRPVVLTSQTISDDLS